MSFSSTPSPRCIPLPPLHHDTDSYTECYEVSFSPTYTSSRIYPENFQKSFLDSFTTIASTSTLTTINSSPSRSKLDQLGSFLARNKRLLCAYFLLIFFVCAALVLIILSSSWFRLKFQPGESMLSLVPTVPSSNNSTASSPPSPFLPPPSAAPLPTTPPSTPATPPTTPPPTASPPIGAINQSKFSKSGQGDGTFYNPGAGVGACEWANQDSELIAAISIADFGIHVPAASSPACGACLTVTGPNGSVSVKVVDKCPGCKQGDVDLSPSAFQKIASLDAGRIKVTWKSC